MTHIDAFRIERAVGVENARRFVKAFAQPGRPRIIFGRNVYAEAVTRQMALDGLVDEYTELTEAFGLPVMKLRDIPPNALVLVVSGGSTLSALTHVLNAGLDGLDYFSFRRFAVDLELPEVVFNEGFANHHQAHVADYARIAERLEDDESRQTLHHLIEFRRSEDATHLLRVPRSSSRQYFEPFLPVGNAEVLIDVGGFNAADSLYFVNHVPGAVAHVVEADPRNVELCRSKAQAHENVACYHFAASSKAGVGRMNLNMTQSRVEADGKVEVPTRTLDSMFYEHRPTYLKMDIEGHELEALHGAEKIIRDHRPKLAICVYHKVGDYFVLPDWILSIQPDYKIRLRHYTETIYETVMYFC